MRRVDKPWGYELIWAETSRYVGKVIHITAGQRLSRQYHEVKEETLFVQTGTMVLEIGPAEAVETKRLGPGEVFHVTPRTIHRMIAETDVDVIEVSTPELMDVVRLEDAYGREGTSKP
jgi:mannose-6-phosphate isomerase